LEIRRGVNSATPNSRAINCPTSRNEVASFSSHLTPNQRKKIEKIITLGDLNLAKTLLAFYLPEYFDIPFWYQYTDHVIRNDKDFYCHLNYIHQNCVKHGLSKKVSQYKFSSYNSWLREKGKLWIREVLEKYPIVDFGGEWLE
jgi:hypothetical protein